MKSEIEKRASKFINKHESLELTTMEIMVMFAEKELEFQKQIIRNIVMDQNLKKITN